MTYDTPPQGSTKSCHRNRGVRRHCGWGAAHRGRGLLRSKSTIRISVQQSPQALITGRVRKRPDRKTAPVKTSANVCSTSRSLLSARLPELIHRQRNHQQPDHDKIYPSHRNTNTHRPRAYYQPDSEYNADPFLPRAKSRQRYDLGHDNQKSENHRGLCRCGVKTEWQNPR